MTALMGLAARLRLARLVLRTDARRRQGDLAAFLTAALAGGVDVVQVRQDDLDAATGRAVLEEVRAVAATSGAVVGVAGDPAWAGAVGADLLHLRPGDDASAARAALHPDALLGRSAHDGDQLDAALADEALDFVAVGPGLVARAARTAPVFAVASTPWFVGGGVGAATLDDLLAAGARRVLVGSALADADDPQDAAARLTRSLADAWRADPGAERYRFAAAATPGRAR
ncbi:thiamine phosphate synthase [Microlunatus capsulatus]|uniref:Thiamine-phosphate pyrophosphorylase n=1 Tax=Microlunatus capsulatus TaxID=99117 RepID=A0ABS4ZBD6_9ACTN|nr:thiamine phosphate synthase [Microlunatus capsulatus]MBP2418372.1 thiamine-phosphate pyrophosphorylase [Microlunatus capsulatus]